MTYSISIIFFLTILVAVEAALFKRQVQWTVLVTTATGLILLLSKWHDFRSRLATSKDLIDHPESDLNSTSVAPASVISKALIVSVIALCFVAAVFSLLVADSNSVTGKVQIDGTRQVSAYSVLTLGTLLLSSSVVPMPKRSVKSLRTAFSLVIFLALALSMFFLIDPLSWYVYMACRSIENATLDPNHILGAPRMLLYRAAGFKASIGVLGWCLWLSVAFCAYRYVQRKTAGMFSAMWLACALGVFTTLSMWRFVLSDFPELDMSVTDLLNDLRQGKYSYNLVLFLILSATGFLQFCLIDRNSDQLIEVKRDPKYVTGQVWRNRFLGLMMMLPALLILANAFNLDPQAFSMFGWLALVFMVSELIANDSLLLLGLLVLGTRKIADAHNTSLNHVPITAQGFLQLVLVGCILVVFLPLHFAASQFYFDAVIMLSPI